MVTEHRAAFEDLNDSIDPLLTTEWATMSTEPCYKNGRWISVFSMTESPGKLDSRTRYNQAEALSAMSMTQKLKELSEREERTVHTEGTPPPVPGAAAWVVQGMELEVIQYA